MARLPNTMIYSRKAYHEDRKLKEIVEETEKIATSLENHKELIKEHFPNYQIMELYTYEHTGMCIEKFKRCEWDSSLDGMSVFKKETDLDEKLEIINKNLI